MKWAIAALCVVGAVVFVTTRPNSGDDPANAARRNIDTGLTESDQGGASLTAGAITERSATDSFAEANWSLKAEPGAVRKHQRIDPVTGKPVALSDEQAEVSNDDPQSELERLEAEEKKKARWKQIGFGDPNAELEAVR